MSSSAWISSELFAGASHVASYSGGTTVFEHSDWLGTVRARSNVSGGLMNTLPDLPFGDAQAAANPDWSQLHFTGQLWDSESSITHTMFRQYNSTSGRWISPDPSGMAAVDPANPQSWNRYAYVGNNPINSVDPLGLYGECWFDCGGYCPPEYRSCFDPCDDDPLFCGDPPLGGRPGTGGGGGGRPHAPLPPDAQTRTGGRYSSINNETLGLPPGINFKALSLADLFGMNPNGPCDFGVCAPVGMGAIDNGP